MKKNQWISCHWHCFCQRWQVAFVTHLRQSIGPSGKKFQDQANSRGKELEWVIGAATGEES